MVLEGGGVGGWAALGHALSGRAGDLGPAAAPEPDHAAGRAVAHPPHRRGSDGELSRAVCGAGEGVNVKGVFHTFLTAVGHFFNI